MRGVLIANGRKPKLAHKCRTPLAWFHRLDEGARWRCPCGATWHYGHDIPGSCSRFSEGRFWSREPDGYDPDCRSCQVGSHQPHPPDTDGSTNL